MPNSVFIFDIYLKPKIVLSFFDIFPRNLNFSPRAVCVGSVVNKITLEQIYHKVFQFLPVYPITGSVDI